MKLRDIRDWKRRWHFRRERDAGGYVQENRYEILRNGVVVGRIQKEWGGWWFWRIYTSPSEYGQSDTMSEALHDARDTLGLRPTVPADRWHLEPEKGPQPKRGK